MKLIFTLVVAALCFAPTSTSGQQPNDLDLLEMEPQQVAGAFVQVSGTSNSIIGDGLEQHSRSSRKLQSKTRKKEKGKSSKGKTSKKSSANVAINENDNDEVLEVLSSNRPSCTLHSQCRGRGIGDDRSNGCWMGHCMGCLPGIAKCYCGSNESGGDADISNRISEQSFLNLDGISQRPVGGGQYQRVCETCRVHLVASGVVQSATYCLQFSGGVQVRRIGWPRGGPTPLHFFTNFGPPNSGDIGRERGACHFNQPTDGPKGVCKLFCGYIGQRRMYIDYDLRPKGNSFSPEESGIDYSNDRTRVWKNAVVHGLGRVDSGTTWYDGCRICGRNLERTGFIEGGWMCRRAHGQWNTPRRMRLHLAFRDGTD